MKGLLSVSEAKQKILSSVSHLGTEKVALSDAYERVLALDVLASIDIPSFDNASMDGFVIRAADVVSADENNPVILKVIADIPAGNHPTIKIHPGQAARIVTGAMIPKGGDAVIPVEDTDIKSLLPGSREPEKVGVYRSIKSGDFVRPRGQDIEIGDILLKKNKRLRPQDIGVIAMQGIAEVDVFLRPKIGLISTGDELLAVGAPLTPGKIYETNSFSLQGLIKHCRCDCVYLGIGADTPESVRKILNRAVDEEVDLIVSSAGVSMGAYDYVHDILAKEGQLGFWKVNMRPGKPLAHGSYKEIPFIGLPGNPVSAIIGFEVFVKPMLDKMSGMGQSDRPTMAVRLLDSIESDGRESYLRALVSREENEWVAKLTGHQGSGNLLSLVQANAILIIPAGITSLKAGSEVGAWMLSDS